MVPLYFCANLHVAFIMVPLYNITITKQTTKEINIMKEYYAKYRVITENGKELVRYDTYYACKSFWNDLHGVWEDEDGNEVSIYIDEFDNYISGAIEAEKIYSDNYYYIDSPYKLKGRGIKELGAHWAKGSYKDVENYLPYRVTEQAFIKLKAQYNVIYKKVA